MRQRDAIDRACREQLAEGEPDVVDVWGPPELRLRNERYCTEDVPAVVVYHPRAVRTNDGRGFACPDCGKATAHGGTA